ncbi:hypothetical protein Tco_0383278 [Tanacetum coccineum]
MTMEELDMRWQMAMLTMRARMFLKNTGRKLTVNGNETIGFDKSKVEYYSCHKRGHFSMECRALRNQQQETRKAQKKTLCLWKHLLLQLWCHVMVLVDMSGVIRQRNGLIMHSWLSHLQIMTQRSRSLEKETEHVNKLHLLPIMDVDLPFSQDLKSSHDDGSKPSSDDGKKVDEDPRKDSECNDQEKEDNVNSTNNVNVAWRNVADMNNFDTTIQVIPFLRSSTSDQVIGDLQLATTKRRFQRIWRTGDEEGKEVEFILRSMIGSLMYLSTEPHLLTLTSPLFKHQAQVKTINKEAQLHALVDGKKIIITKSSVRRDLQLADEEDEEITLVSVQNVDEEMFDVNVLDGEKVFVTEQEVVVKEVNDEVNVVKEVVEVINPTKLIIDVAQVSAAGDIVSTAGAATTKKDLRQERKAEKEKEAIFALIETMGCYNRIIIDVDHQLAERLQAQEQEELSVEEKATLFQQLLEKRRREFCKLKRAEEKRQQTTIKLTEKDIVSIQKKAKVEDDKETAKLKQCLEIIPDEEEVTIDAIPLAVKSPTTVSTASEYYAVDELQRNMLNTKLGKGMVLRKDYLLGGLYHGNDSIFLLNCYGVRWQVEVKCLFSNMISLVGPIWADFVMHNVTMLHFIKEYYDVERMGWFCNWWWHTTHADKRISFYKKLTPEVLKMGRIKVPKEFVVSHKLHGYSSAVVSRCHKKIVFKLRKKAVFKMFSTPPLRCMKDQSGFWAEQWVRFYLSEDTTLKDGVIRFEV